ncbi:universal stress protein [Maribacter ulvicola]|uniref:Universal stress protein family protein n=1 Tax=Maribacter ulvicola TaxID=228959 RepID=A0A1N6SN84_9FLAO|nr:universal stress protein [Maribacter ulvicola]SIQ42530.1 Universal stress protein family protein [Maribacter ulvicola]
MENRILLPTDFSKNSWNAIQYAIKLFEEKKCIFYILHTYSKETHGLDSLTLLDPDQAFNKMCKLRSEQGLGDILVQLSKLQHNDNHQFHVVSKPALLCNAVKELNKELRFKMIVMGAKGITNQKEETYGKQTLGLLKEIRQCPILVVPTKVDFNHPKEIVLTTNFNSKIKVSEIRYLVEIAKLSNASIQVLSLTQPHKLSFSQKRNKVLIRSQLKDVAHKFNSLRNVKMATALSCFVEIRKSNMISYIDRKPSFWERLGFVKISLSKLGYFANVPVLALHAK